MCTIANEATQYPTSGLDNDIPTIPASLVKFDGANYLLWSQSMLLAIGSVGGGEYVGYLTGMKKKPNSGETLVARWTQEDSFVKSYLIYHMTPEVATRYMIVATAAEIWTSVKERYSTPRNGARIFELQKKIREHKQEGTTVTHYYATLCSMYQELDVYRSGKYQKFDSTVVPKLQKLEDEDRLFTFLTGLSGAYIKVIQEILMRDPLPTLQQAFQLVNQEHTGQKDPNKPKRPPSAFYVFLEEFRIAFKKEKPNVKSVAAVGKAGGLKWKSMSAAEKALYAAKADRRKTEYEKQMNAYNKKWNRAADEDDEESDESEFESDESEFEL